MKGKLSRFAEQNNCQETLCEKTDVHMSLSRCEEQIRCQAMLTIMTGPKLCLNPVDNSRCKATLALLTTNPRLWVCRLKSMRQIIVTEHLDPSCRASASSCLWFTPCQRHGEEPCPGQPGSRGSDAPLLHLQVQTFSRFSPVEVVDTYLHYTPTLTMHLRLLCFRMPREQIS